MKRFQSEMYRTVKYNTISICSLILWVAFPLLATDSIDKFDLFIKPKICILENRLTLCEQLVEVSWELKKEQPVCLYIQGRSGALACWKKHRADSNEFMIETSEKIIFQLKNSVSEKVIYSSTYKVYRKIAQYRRKRRNPWSFY